MIPYIEVFGFLLLGGAIDVFGQNERKKHILYVFSVVLLMGFLGLRGFVGWDWWAYYPSYYNLPNGFNYEIGYEIWTGIFYKTGISYEHFILLNSIVNIGIIAIVFKNIQSILCFHYFYFYQYKGFLWKWIC